MNVPHRWKMETSKRVLHIPFKSLWIDTLYTLVRLAHRPCTLSVNALYIYTYNEMDRYLVHPCTFTYTYNEMCAYGWVNYVSIVMVQEKR